MNKLISLVFLFTLANSSLLAQSGQINIDSLKRVHVEERRIAEFRKVKVDEAIKRIESSELSDEEINRIILPILEEYNVNNYKEFLLKYDSLLLKDQFVRDSLDLQIIKIDSLYQFVNNGEKEQRRIDSLKQENERLKAIMKGYVAEILLLNSTASIDSAGLYYYNLDYFKKPKIYFYRCPQDPKRSQYWKVSSNLKNKTLITEVFDINLVQFERYEEKYDAFGSKLLVYNKIGSDSVTSTKVEKDDMYLWESTREFSYQVKYNRANEIFQFSKTRKFQRIDSLFILGKMQEVLVFNEEYWFYNISNNATFKYSQFSYFAKGIGFVKREQSIPISDSAFEFINLELETILTKKEWKKWRKRKISNK